MRSSLLRTNGSVFTPLPITASVTTEESIGKGVYGERFKALPNQLQWTGTNGTIIIAEDTKREKPGLTHLLLGHRNTSTVAIKLFAEEKLRNHTVETLEELQNPKYFISFAVDNDHKACIFEAPDLHPHRPYAIALQGGDRSLQDVMAATVSTRQTISLDWVSHVMSQVLTGLKVLHDLERVHGDLKPSNIILVADDATGFLSAKLTDFDHCCVLDGEIAEYSTYICPPEAAAQRLAAQPVTARTSLDIWAVGSIMYEMIMGKPLTHKLVAGAVSLSREQLFTALKGVTQEQVDDACEAVERKYAGTNVVDKGLNAAALLRLMLQVDIKKRKHAGDLLTEEFFTGGDQEEDMTRKELSKIDGKVDQVLAGIERMQLNLTELLARTTQLSSLAAGLDQVKVLVEKGHTLMTQLADNECPRTFVILPEVPIGHPDAGIKEKMQRWGSSIKNWLTSPPSNETGMDKLKGRIADMLVDNYRLYLVCEVTGERQGQGYEIKAPKELVTAVLPYMFVGFKVVGLVNAGLNLAKTMWPVPSIPDDAMDNAREVLSLLDQPNTAAPWAPVAEALEAGTGKTHEQLGSALRVFRDFLDSSDPKREWAGLQRCYTKEGKVLWASAKAVEQLQEGRVPGSTSAAPTAAATAGAEPAPAPGGHPSVSNDGSGITAGASTSATTSPNASGKKLNVDQVLPGKERPAFKADHKMTADEWSLLGAVYRQDTALVQQLLAKDSPPLNPNATATDVVPAVQRPYQEGFVHAAARTGQVEVVRMLLDAGANIDAVDQQKGRTALHWAAREGHDAVVQLLLQRGADVHARDRVAWMLGRTPLRLAKQHYKAGAAKVLEEWTALHPQPAAGAPAKLAAGSSGAGSAAVRVGAPSMLRSGSLNASM